MQSRLNSGGNAKTFLYRFDAVTGLNFVKKLVQCEAFEGASHGDDLAYLWKHDGHMPAETPKIDSVEFQMIKKMVTFMKFLLKNEAILILFYCYQVSIYTTFAITGNPNNAEMEDVVWEPITSTQLPLSCLNISEKELEMMFLPESKRLKVWDSVYNDASVALY